MTPNELPDESLNRVITDGLRFLESLTNHYGSEKGMEIWEAIGTAVGTEVKGKIFFAMTTGRRSGKIGFQAGNAAFTQQAVPVIKCIRTYTGSGLKEAKDLWDNSKSQTVFVEVDPEQQIYFERDMRALGCIIQ